MFIPAYIDPGAGAMLLQWLLAAGIGTLLLFHRSIARILGLSRKKKPDADAMESDDDSAEKAQGNDSGIPAKTARKNDE
jgi:hypothetical protein